MDKTLRKADLMEIYRSTLDDGTVKAWSEFDKLFKAQRPPEVEPLLWVGLYVASAFEQRQTLEACRRIEQCRSMLTTEVADSLTGVFDLYAGDFRAFALSARAAMFSRSRSDMEAIGFDVPLWDLDPSSLDGQHVLLTLGGGFGDHFWLARFMPELLRRAASVTIPTWWDRQHPIWAPWARLVEHDPKVTFLPKNQDNGSTLWVTLWDLISLGETNIPAPVHRSMSSEETRRQMRSIVGQSAVLTVGLSFDAKCEANSILDRPRNQAKILADPVQDLLPLWQMAARGEIRLINLMPRYSGQFHRMPTVDPALPLDSWGWAETEALIEICDVVVATDSSVANLAGSMGKDLRVLAPWVSDPRWGAFGRQDTPWFPSARVYRQPWAGCWWMPVAQLAGDLRKLAVGGQRIAA